MRVVVLVCVALCGCAGAVHMRNPVTGQIASCGPYTDTINAPAYQGQCIHDFQVQGFVRMPD